MISGAESELLVEGRPAEKILAGLAQFPPGFLPAALFAPATDGAVPQAGGNAHLQAALAALEESGEVERRGQRLRLAEGVRERLLAALDYEESVAATEEALGLVLAAFPGDPGNYGNWNRCAALMLALRSITRRAVELEMESPRAVLGLALGSEFLTARGDFKEAEGARAVCFPARPALLGSADRGDQEPRARRDPDRAR